VGSLIEALVADIARRHGLTHAAVNALAVIEGNGGPMAAGEVGSRMHITSGTVTTVLDTLERNGYVTRRADPTDRRRVLVDITPAAEAVLDAVLPEIQQAASAAMSGFGDEALDGLLATLTAVREALAALPTDLEKPKPRRGPRHLRRT
jgi:DNA-binding MarR family transcriptional regulator